MPTLREMLDKQKQEKTNGIAKPNQGREQIIPANPISSVAEEKPGSEINANVSRGNEPNSRETKADTGTAILEQGPPAGLSGLALLRWRRENKNAKSSTGNVASTSQNIEPEKISGNTPDASKPENGNNNNTVQSASQAADAQKTNDGAINVEQLRNDLTYLANNIEQKEIVKQIVQKIAIQLKQTPELTPYMTDQDVNLMVRGLRSSYATAARKKTEKAETGKKKSALDNELAAAFASGGISLT